MNTFRCPAWKADRSMQCENNDGHQGPHIYGDEGRCRSSRENPGITRDMILCVRPHGHSGEHTDGSTYAWRSDRQDVHRVGMGYPLDRNDGNLGCGLPCLDPRCDGHCQRAVRVGGEHAGTHSGRCKDEHGHVWLWADKPKPEPLKPKGKTLAAKAMGWD